MKINKSIFIILVTAFVFLLGSCNEKEVIEAPMMNARASGVKSVSKKAAFATTLAMDMADSKFYYDEIEMEESAQQSSVRKLIKTGSVTLEIDTLSESEKLVEEFAKNFGGYITDSSMYESSFNATVKIPETKFDQAMAATSDLGKLKYRSVNNQDVTEEFYDLQTRINTKKIMKEKLESYLSQAKDIRDLLEIERQLNSVVSELESMQGRMNRLSNQIDYSTIYVNLNLPTGFDDTGYKWPDLGEGFREFCHNFVNFMASLLLGFFYIIVFGIPLIALAAFLFWLLFGKIGLLVKLFKKLRGNKKS